jgi:hypothetical protein
VLMQYLSLIAPISFFDDAEDAVAHRRLCNGRGAMTKSTLKSIHAGDKVIRDAATQDQRKVRLGDQAPVFVRTVRAGDKVVRDVATQDQHKVRLGDQAPIFGR